VDQHVPGGLPERAVPGRQALGHGKMLGAAFVEVMTQIKSIWMKVGA
jgi:hypothetical protein